MHAREASAADTCQIEISWIADMSGIEREKNDLSFDRMRSLSVIHIIHSVWLKKTERVTNDVAVDR